MLDLKATLSQLQCVHKTDLQHDSVDRQKQKLDFKIKVDQYIFKNIWLSKTAFLAHVPKKVPN